MRMVHVVLASVALASTGCFLSFLSPIPIVRTPEDRAHALDTKCHGLSATGAPPRAFVDTVTPAYSYVPGGPQDRLAHLRGAVLHLRPLPGTSKESLTRDLECHEASVVLGRNLPAETDPYVLPGRWVDIDVDSERDGFAVSVRADAMEDARAVLERARTYARAEERVE